MTAEAPLAPKPMPADVAEFIDDRIAPLMSPWDSLKRIARSCYVAGLQDGITIECDRRPS